MWSGYLQGWKVETFPTTKAWRNKSFSLCLWSSLLGLTHISTALFFMRVLLFFCSFSNMGWLGLMQLWRVLRTWHSSQMLLAWWLTSMGTWTLASQNQPPLLQTSWGLHFSWLSLEGSSLIPTYQDSRLVSCLDALNWWWVGILLHWDCSKIEFGNHH